MLQPKVSEASWLSLGPIPTGHDLLCFLRDFMPTITALVAAENESAEQKHRQ
jgi:hypothetical protein